MNILLLGYGKMGKTIEKLAIDRGHKIALIIDRGETEKLSQIKDTDIDVAIEFTEPEAAVLNIRSCIDGGIPIVSGTTGWLQKYDEIKSYCEEKEGAFFYGSNYSIGVNIFFKLNEFLAKLMDTQDYELEMSETHHTEKKDAPSGTAISIAEGIIKQNKKYTKWALDKNKKDDTEIPITAHRIENVPGTHEVIYHSDIDNISIKHTAHSRKGFAFGAVLAAEWLKDKKGVFGMNDLLQF